MKHQDLSDQLNQATIMSLRFRRDFTVNAMHYLLWRRIFPIRQTNNDPRLADYEAVYEELGQERDLYEKFMSKLPFEILLSIYK